MVKPITDIRKQITVNRFLLTGFCLLLIAYCLLPAVLSAQDGGTPGALLNYGMTPRTLAMGKTFTGLADDQEAIYFNPAGLVQLMSHNVKSAYLSLLGTNLGYLGYALPTKRFGSIGLGLIYHGTPEIDSYNSAGDPFGTFKFNENAFLFSYAHQPAPWIGLGTTIKVLSTRIAQYGALGMGGDLGALILPRRNLTFGVVIQNILGPKLTYIDQTDEVPLTFRVGTALKLYKGRAVLALDVSKNIIESSSVEPHFGIEFIPVFPLLTLRGGIDRNHVSAGVGIRYDWNKLSLGFDYAVLLHYNSSYLVPYRHKIGINITFAGFRTWVDADPKRFSPTPGRKENIAWLDLHYNTKREIERWQLLVKNQFGEVVRTYGGWNAPPLRLSWDGLDDVGRVVSDGLYYYEIILIDEAGDNYTYSDALTRVATMGPEGEIEFLPQE
ncbi:hypothetical protein A2Y85_05440 [candidate division WOR-3 bacterium RBG_13_43_14]|uniref:FlgD Ig-like domain-containing protein n=1 Tax=candidate division WOR-3 bacterium RBG_13_43_14 TaxID=1802590 RepID=A0A1F4U921_UNCW3|nr:MAG: hypothetical protein A2Y85_05440 [candidate division WOR-3 bacterium RBG_13_43_14]